MNNPDHETVLVQVTVNDENTLVCIAAINRITDPAVHIQAAKNDRNKAVRLAAINNLSDQSDLTHLARNDKDVTIRRTAIVRLEDQYGRIGGIVRSVGGCGSVILLTKESTNLSEPHGMLSGEFLLLKIYKMALYKL